MPTIRIFGQPGEWHVEHDGKVANTFETKESAFEAAAAAASIALRRGHEIMITAPGSADGAEATHGCPILSATDGVCLNAGVDGKLGGRDPIRLRL